MDLNLAIDLIDEQLRSEARTNDVQSTHSDISGVWVNEGFRAEVAPAGPTGIELRLSSNGRTIHERIFANSPASIPRIARAVSEHLTGYVK
jgi:hypothetical protein